MIRILVVGQTPPPYGGQALSIERLLRAPLRGLELFHVRMHFSHTLNELGCFRWGKVWHLFWVILQIYYHRLAHGVRILYYPPAGPQVVPALRDMAILLATRWLFRQTIFHFHAAGVSELYPRLPWLLRGLYRLAYYRAAAAIRLSQYAPEDPQRLQALTEYVVPYGIDDVGGEHLRRAASRATGGPLRLLFVGYLAESKGILVFLDACARLADAGVAFTAEVVGEYASPEIQAQVEQTLARTGLRDGVSIRGVLVGEAKWAAYARAEVLCLPTFFEAEALPLVVIEAMSIGLPVVATRWRGIPSLIDDSRTGYLVEVRDPEALAERLARLAADPALRAQLGTAAREKFLREYVVQRHLERMEAVFQAVGATRPAACELVRPAVTVGATSESRIHGVLTGGER